MLEIHAVNGEMKSYNELYSEHNYSFENLSRPQLCDIFMLWMYNVREGYKVKTELLCLLYEQNLLI